MRLGMIFWVFCIFLGVPYGAEAFSWSDDADEIVGRHGTPQEYSEKKDDTRSLWASAMSMGRISPAFGCEKGIVSYAYWDGPGDYVSTQKTFFFEDVCRLTKFEYSFIEDSSESNDGSGPMRVHSALRDALTYRYGDAEDEIYRDNNQISGIRLAALSRERKLGNGYGSLSTFWMDEARDLVIHLQILPTQGRKGWEPSINLEYLKYSFVLSQQSRQGSEVQDPNMEALLDDL